MSHCRFIYGILYSLVFVLISHGFSQRLTLNQSIHEALAHNPDILSVKQKVEASRAIFWEGISPEYPEFFVEYEGIPDKQSLSDFGEKKYGFSQELDFPLSYIFKYSLFQSDKKWMDGEYVFQRNKLIHDVKSGFYRVVLLKKQLELFQEIVQIIQKNFRMAQIRVFAGESSPYDTLKVKVDLAEVENRVLSVKKTLEVARSELRLLLGRQEGDHLEIIGDLDFSPISFTQDSLYRLALINHPSLIKAMADVDRENAKRSLAWTDLLPDIHLRYFRQELPGEYVSRCWGGEVGVSFPLWFFLKGQGSIRSSTHNLEASQWLLESQKRRVLIEVEKALGKLLVAEKLVLNFKENTLREVEELVRIAVRSYEEGEMGYLEVAEAMQTYNRIKVSYLQALYDNLVALAGLELAVGLSLSSVM